MIKLQPLLYDLLTLRQPLLPFLERFHQTTTTRPTTTTTNACVPGIHNDYTADDGELSDAACDHADTTTDRG